MDKIICAGKNYEEHMRELGDKPVEKPVLFLKPPSILKQCLDWDGKIEATLPDAETHYECELVFKLKRGGYKLTPKEAMQAIDSFTIGLDMTLRKVQSELKKQGAPWTISKVFPDACIIGPWLDANQFSNILNMEFSFTLNNVLKQKSHGSNMLFKPCELICYISNYFPICEGDILFTGTPSGVGPVFAGSVGVLKIDQFSFEVQWMKTLT